MRAPEHEKYMTWDFYKAKLQNTCDVAEGDTNALCKMQNTKYKDNIVAYLDRLQFLNKHADISKAALRNVVHKVLSDAIIQILPMCESMDSDKQIWKTIKKAGKTYKETKYILKIKSSGGGGGGGESGL